MSNKLIGERPKKKNIGSLEMTRKVNFDEEKFHLFSPLFFLYLNNNPITLKSLSFVHIKPFIIPNFMPFYVMVIIGVDRIDNFPVLEKYIIPNTTVHEITGF